MIFKNPSLITRVAIGKTIGLVVGLCGFISVAFLVPDAGWQLRWGVLLWYTTMGAVIGMFGVFTWHPILHLPMPWWVRAPVVGAWLNFVLTFFAYDDMKMVLEQGFSGVVVSPFWFVLEGAVVGGIIGYFATRFGGEGKETVEQRLVAET